jgi:NADPH-dependent curcumin reductase CurA
MNDAKSYVPPFEVGRALEGAAVGEVVASGADSHRPGDLVLHNLGWREFALLPAAQARTLDPTAGADPAAYLGVLGVTGFTAYVGLLDIAEFKAGEVVYVSAAAGAVGSIAGQIAKLRGAATVIGSAGTPEKVARLLELGFDAAFDYHEGTVRDQLRAAAPDGIDVYFDNVGGHHLAAAIAALRPFGRVAMCGAISQYNAAAPDGVDNLTLVIGKRLTLRGFIVLDHGGRRKEFVSEMSGWLRSGAVRYDETTVDGLENAPDAFLSLLRGGNVGKMIVRLTD